MINCIFYGKEGKLETCTILNYCKNPDKCIMRIDGKIEFNRKFYECLRCGEFFQPLDDVKEVLCPVCGGAPIADITRKPTEEELRDIFREED